MDHEDDIQLKFDGTPVKQLGGAPAEVVISALSALQRLVHLIGMQEEGRVFGQRVKPSSRVRREFSIVCRPSAEGSLIQPFDVGSSSGLSSRESSYARGRLLTTLMAFSSGNAEAVERAVPDARERWFFANATAGLIPDEDSGIQITIKPVAQRNFTFKADQARNLVERFKSGVPPAAGERKVSGKLRAIDFDNSAMVIKPSSARAFRVGYTADIESMLQANARRKLTISGIPSINNAGDVTGFEKINSISEAEGSLAAIDRIESDEIHIATNRPIRILATYDLEDKLFIYQDPTLGIDAWSERFNELRKSVIEEIDMLWQNYAQADENELDEEATAVRRSLLSRFKAV